MTTFFLNLEEISEKRSANWYITKMVVAIGNAKTGIGDLVNDASQ